MQVDAGEVNIALTVTGSTPGLFIFCSLWSPFPSSTYLAFGSTQWANEAVDYIASVAYLVQSCIVIAQEGAGLFLTGRLFGAAPSVFVIR